MPHAWGAIWNPGEQISKAGAEFIPPGPRGAILKSGTQYWGPGFFNYVSPGGGTCQVMHSGDWDQIVDVTLPNTLIVLVENTSFY